MEEWQLVQFLDDFGPFDARYEGTGWVSLRGGSRRRVSFEARQLANSRVVVGLIGRSPLQIKEAQRVTGWAVNPDWRIAIQGLTPAQWREHIPGLSHGVAYATDMILTHPFGVSAGTTQMDFSFANLVVPGWPHVGSPLVVDVPGYRVTLRPLGDYEPNAERLLRTSGILPTVECRIWPIPYKPIIPRFAKAAMDEVSSGLSLCTGTKVSWISYRIADRQIGHRSSVAKEFSSTVHNLEWVLDIASCVPSYMKVKDRLFVREMIDYLTDVTAPGLFLETRSLTASTLLDALTNRYARQVSYETYVNGSEWKTLRPRLIAAIDKESSKLGLGSALSGHVDGLRRYSFEEKLVRVLNDKGIPHPNVAHLVKVRNSLVHTGNFPGPDRFESFKLLIWTSFAVLAKLAGYPGVIKPL